MLPTIVDYLLSLRRPSGSWLVYRGGLQVVVPIFPPNITITYTVTPLFGAYAQLGWATRFGTDMIANAFTGFVQQHGSKPYTGTISQRIINDPVSYLIMVTESEPTMLYITNNSPLAQRLEVIGDYLVISSEDDYNAVLDALGEMHRSTKLEGLANETNRLLERLIGGPVILRPPPGGV